MRDSFRLRQGPRVWSLAWAALVLGWVGMPASVGQAADLLVGGLPFSVPAGFVVEQAAGPPLVERPVTLTFDDSGRLFVTESSGSNAPLAEQQADPRHRVLRLEDTDGDGRYDRRTVFADGLMMLQGSLWHQGSLYVAAPPQILRLTDTDGDGVADERAVWHDGGTLTGCGNDVHGPALGPDGRLYFTKGGFAEQSYDLPGRPAWKTRAAHVFRARTDGSDLEPVLTGGMDNPVDVAFLATGERLLSATFLQQPAAGRRDGVVHAVYGGVYGKQHGVLDDHPWTGELLPVLAHLGPAAACGLHVHSGFGLGKEFADNAFVCQFNLRSVVRLRLKPAGATFTMQAEPFLSVDAVDFHPTDVIEDADGSLLVVDTGGWYKLCCPTSQREKPAALGGIYRVRRQGVGRPTDPRGKTIAWDQLEISQLVSLLADDRPVVVARAIETLAGSGPAAAAPVAELLTAGGKVTVSGRLAAVRLLTRLETAEARALLRQALSDRSPAVRQAAAHAAALHRDVVAVDRLAEIVVLDEPAVARVAAEALGRIGGAQAVGALLKGCRREADRMFEHSLIYGLIEAGNRSLLLEAMQSPDSRVRRAALIAVDQLPLQSQRPPPLDDPTLQSAVVAACRDTDPALRDTGLWLVSHHPAWADDLAADVGGMLARITGARTSQPPRGVEADQLAARLARIAGRPAVATAVAAACESTGSQLEERVVVALGVMGEARLIAVPDSWVAAIRLLLEQHVSLGADGSGHVAASTLPVALQTLCDLRLATNQRNRLRPLLWAIAADPRLPVAQSLAAIQAADSPRTLPDGVLNRLTALLVAKRDQSGADEVSPLDRIAAARVIAETQIAKARLLTLAGAFDRLPGSELAILLPAVTHNGGGPLVLAIERLAERSEFEALPRSVLAAAVAALPAGRKAAGEQLLATVEASRAAVWQGYRQLASSLPKGDAGRGHAVFFSNKAGCTTCHALAYAGGRVGPDLTRIGRIRTAPDLLEAIVMPSASFVRSYEPVSLLTVDGKVHSGIIKDETTSEVVLQTSATATERIPRRSIEEIAAGTVSVMPKGYDKLLTPQELADLVAFLAASK